MYSAFSDNGSPSSTRLLMGFFSLFTCAILWRILSHLLKVSNDNNVTALTVWLSNLPLIITALCALIALPYSVSRGASAISDLAGMVAAYKNGTPPPPPAVTPDPGQQVVQQQAIVNTTTTTATATAVTTTDDTTISPVQAMLTGTSGVKG